MKRSSDSKVSSNMILYRPRWPKLNFCDINIIYFCTCDKIVRDKFMISYNKCHSVSTSHNFMKDLSMFLVGVLCGGILIDTEFIHNGTYLFSISCQFVICELLHPKAKNVAKCSKISINHTYTHSYGYPTFFNIMHNQCIYIADMFDGIKKVLHSNDHLCFQKNSDPINGFMIHCMYQIHKEGPRIYWWLCCQLSLLWMK